MTGQFEIDANLALERDGAVIDVWDEGDVLVVNAPSFRAIRGLRDTLATLPSVPSNVADRITEDDRFDEIGITVEIRVRHATVARFGAGVDGTGIAARLLGRPGEMNWRGVVAAAVRRLG